MSFTREFFADSSCCQYVESPSLASLFASLLNQCSRREWKWCSWESDRLTPYAAYQIYYTYKQLCSLWIYADLLSVFRDLLQSSQWWKGVQDKWWAHIVHISIPSGYISICHTEFKYFGEMTNTRKHFAFQSNVGEKQSRGTIDQLITASTQIKKGQSKSQTPSLLLSKICISIL